MVPIVRKTHLAFLFSISRWSHPTHGLVEDGTWMWPTFIQIATRDTADRTFLTWYIPIIKDLALSVDFLHLLKDDPEREKGNYNKFINESKFDIMKHLNIR